MGDQIARRCQTKPDSNIRRTVFEIDNLQRGIDQHINLTVPFPKTFQFWNKPGCGEGRFNRNNQPFSRIRRAHHINRIPDLGEPGRQHIAA